ncbi:MAG: hypothetical protein ACC630_06840 [Nitrospinota bacterium]
MFMDILLSGILNKLIGGPGYPGIDTPKTGLILLGIIPIESVSVRWDVTPVPKTPPKLNNQDIAYEDYITSVDDYASDPVYGDF